MEDSHWLIQITRFNQKDDLRNRKAVLRYIKINSVELNMNLLHHSADMHLTSMLVPNSANITFSHDYGKYFGKSTNVIVPSCSPTKAINSNPVFRPMIMRHSSKFRNSFQETRLVTYIDQMQFVSCHKEQIHWTNQLKELISPFDTATWLLIFSICFVVPWILKFAKHSHSNARNIGSIYARFSMFWPILDQPSSLFNTNHNTKWSFYFCIYFIPLTWMYLSSLYRGENVTRLLAEPPLIQFDTFKMLEEYQFNIYSVRINLQTHTNAEFHNFGELDKLHKEYGSVPTHEMLPVVSELWYKLMLLLRPYRKFEYSLSFLKHEISTQMWKYINNSAMFPDYGQGFEENISTILNVHMNRCNKSAVILKRPSAIQLDTMLKGMGKPSFLGRDKILETFWGYKYFGYFPGKLYFRARYLFDAGIFEWWQKYFEYFLVLKTSGHSEKLLAKTDNKSGAYEIGGSKTAVLVLTLIPGVGLLFSSVIFICVEHPFRKTVQNYALAAAKNFSSKALKRFRNIKIFGSKLLPQVKNINSIAVRPIDMY